MSQLVLTDAFISINEVNVSGHGTSIALTMSAEAVDTTAFGSGFRKNVGGLKEWSVTAEFNASPDTDFFDLLGETVSVEVRASSAEPSPANPSYSGMAVLTEFGPVDGSVGDAHQYSVSLVSAGPLTREVS